jgi:hypothetical protein
VRKTGYAVCFLGFRIPLGFAPKRGQAAAITWEDTFTWITAGGKAMPLALARVSYIEPEPQARVRNDSQLRLAAAEAFFEAEYQTLRAAQVIRQAVAADLGEDGCEIRLEGTAFENIGIAQGI